MFGKWFNRLPNNFDFYKPTERDIYRYWDGKNDIQVDPLKLYKKLMGVGPELSIDLKLSDSESKAAGEGYDRAASTIREVFSVKPFEEGGLLDNECFELLNHFLEYCETLKKKLKTSATLSTTSVDSKSTSNGNQPTPNLSDSGFVGNGSSIEEPEKSLSESV